MLEIIFNQKISFHPHAFARLCFYPEYNCMYMLNVMVKSLKTFKYSKVPKTAGNE